MYTKQTSFAGCNSFCRLFCTDLGCCVRRRQAHFPRCSHCALSTFQPGQQSFADCRLESAFLHLSKDISMLMHFVRWWFDVTKCMTRAVSWKYMTLKTLPQILSTCRHKMQCALLHIIRMTIWFYPPMLTSQTSGAHSTHLLFEP